MAPSFSLAMTNSQGYLSLSHKLRKPLVEKICRERINSCIEQLRSLLSSPEFLKQQLYSKLEKADILRRLQLHCEAVDSGAVEKGFSRCVQEMVHYLSKKEVKTQPHTEKASFLSSELHSPDLHHQRQESCQQRPLEAVVAAYRLESQTQ